MIHPDVRLGDTVTSFEQFRGSPIAHGFDAISLCRWKEHFFLLLSDESDDKNLNGARSTFY